MDNDLGSINCYVSLYDSVMRCAADGTYGGSFCYFVGDVFVRLPDYKLLSCKNKDELRLLLETEAAIEMVKP